VPAPTSEARQELRRRDSHRHHGVATLCATGHADSTLAHRDALGLSAASCCGRDRREIRSDRSTLMTHGDGDEGTHHGTRGEKDKA
jgi:hypothetical protein